MASASGQPGISRFEPRRVEPPENAFTTHGTTLQTQDMCQQLIADLQCIQLACVFKPKHFDRDVIQTHLKKMVQEYTLLRNNPSQFTSHEEYTKFMTKLRALVGGTVTIIKAIQNRDGIRRRIENDEFGERFAETHPRHKSDLHPWSQYLSANAPALMVAHFLAPYEKPVPRHPNHPHNGRVHCLSLQAAPQAASAIIGKWSAEFKNAIDYYHQLHPQDPEFKGPLAQKLLPASQFEVTEYGLKTLAIRGHNLGNRAYATVMDWCATEGEEEKFRLAAFLGALQGLALPPGHPLQAPPIANRLYVIRRWIFF